MTAPYGFQDGPRRYQSNKVAQLQLVLWLLELELLV
jgi:hypothetical protein